MEIAIIILSLGFLAAIVALFAMLGRISRIRADRAVALERLSAAEKAAEDVRQKYFERESRLSDVEAALHGKTEDLIRSQAEVVRLTKQMEDLAKNYEAERMAAKENQQELARQAETNFKVMAAEIMQQQSKALREQSENRLSELLNPLKENIEQFRRDVNQCYSNEARERFSLQERIKELVEANNSIGREAKELTMALRGNSKKQGDWGELILETILENSGLRKGEEFFVQHTTDESGATLRDDSGRGLRPDVVVNCPDGKVMVIDSKVSLTAFVDYVNANTPEEQERFGRLHLASVMKHINELADKNYQDYVGRERLDFVMMFIPNEGAYSAAMSLDPSIWQKAYDKRVLIVSPTQLVGSLRLISQLWSHDRQTRNAIEIAEKSGLMYDKFVGFVADMEKIDKTLTATRQAYDSAINKLSEGRGNLISRAENLRKLGVKASKRLKGSTYTDSDSEVDPDDQSEA